MLLISQRYAEVTAAGLEMAVVADDGVMLDTADLAKVVAAGFEMVVAVAVEWS